jgi:hypothetical protein
MNIGKNIVKYFIKLRDVAHLKTYQLEQIFVGLVLIIAALITRRGLIEWVGVVAVFLNFGHVSVADRLREAEELRQQRKDPVSVECYKKLDHYYFSKEIFWLLYFVLLGAWSALVGVGLFLLYTPWRRMYRTYHK